MNLLAGAQRKRVPNFIYSFGMMVVKQKEIFGRSDGASQFSSADSLACLAASSTLPSVPGRRVRNGNGGKGTGANSYPELFPVF